MSEREIAREAPEKRNIIVSLTDGRNGREKFSTVHESLASFSKCIIPTSEPGRPQGELIKQNG